MTEFFYGMRCEVANTTSPLLDGLDVIVTGQVTNFGMPGDIYIVEQTSGELFTVGANQWKSLALTNSCLEPMFNPVAE